SDKIGRRRSMIAGVAGLIFVSIFFILFSSNIILIFLGEVSVGILNGLYWPTIEAYISERASEHEHEEKFSNFCISWSLGYMTGPFIAPIIDDVGPVFSFIIFSGIAMTNLVIIVKTLPAKTLHLNAEGREKIEKLRENPGKKENKNWILTLMFVFLASTYSLTKGFIVGIFPDIAKDVDKLAWSGIETGFILLLFGLSRTISFIFLSKNRFKMVAIASIIIIMFVAIAVLFYSTRDPVYLNLFKGIPAFIIAIVVGMALKVGVSRSISEITHGLKKRVLFSVILSSSFFLLIFSNDYLLSCFTLSFIGLLTGVVYMVTLEKLMQITKEGKGLVAGMFESAMGIGTFLSSILGGIMLSLSGPLGGYFLIGLISLALSITSFLLLKAQEKKKKDRDKQVNH
ncbi:MAG: MFS transporter, partial [Promethearchaeota archaeon]